MISRLNKNLDKKLTDDDTHIEDVVSLFSSAKKPFDKTVNELLQQVSRTVNEQSS